MADLVYTAAVRGTHGSTSSDALDYEYNHDARTHSPRLSAARLKLAVGRCRFEPRDRPRRAAHPARVFRGLSIIREYTYQQQSVIVLGSDAWLKKVLYEAPRHVSLRPD